MKTQLKFISKILIVSLATSSLPLPAKTRSLWMSPRNNERGMFADKRATRKGDLLTVIVAESTVTSNVQNTTSSKKTSINDKVTQWLFTPAASGFGTHNGELPATNITGDNSYTGGGSIGNLQSFNTSFTVSIIDTRPNGTLVIEGVRQVLVSGERQYVILTGIVRPEDITPENTIESTRIADAQIEMLSEGTLTEVQKEGWLTKLNNLLNPF